MAFYRCIATAVSGFAIGMAPIMAVEMARRSLSQSLRPEADELEEMLKSHAVGQRAPRPKHEALPRYIMAAPGKLPMPILSPP